jgi:LysR family hydrogen peroxide-inducible transcriptional activator
VLVQVKDMRDLALRASEGAAGVVRFGVTPTLGPYLMPAIIAALHRERPDLRLYIREGIPDEQALELARGQLDMLLSPLPVAGEDLVVEPLLRERFYLVAPPDHCLASAPQVARADLRGLAILSLDHRHHFHRQVTALCEETGMVLLRDYEGTSLDSIRQMVSSGLGLALLPEYYIRSEVGGSAGIRILDVAGWAPSRSIAAAWRSGAPFAPLYLEIGRRIQAEAASLV